MLPAVAASSCPARPHLSSPRNRPRQRDRVLALQLLTLRPDDNAMLNPSSRSERRLRPQLRNHTTSCTTSPEISIRHPPGIRSLPSITKPPKITVAGVPARAPANAKVSTGRSQVTSGPRPPTAPAPPSGRLLTILSVLPARLSWIRIPQAAGSWQLASDSLRPPACLVFSANPGLNVTPPPPPSKPPGPPRPRSNPPAVTEKIVLGPQGAHVHVH